MFLSNLVIQLGDDCDFCYYNLFTLLPIYMQRDDWVSIQK